MDFIDEKDYIMRLIKEAVRVLFSLMLGKQYKSVELQEANKYEVSGDTLEKYERMVDEGFINEAENILLEGIDYAKKEEVLAAVLFYQYISEKDIDFLDCFFKYKILGICNSCNRIFICINMIGNCVFCCFC